MREKPCIDRGVLAEITGGDAALERRLFEHFLAMTVQDVESLRRAIARRDAPCAMRAAHRLRGASGTLGAGALAEVCARMEVAARAADLASLESTLGEFEVQYGRVADYLSGRPGDADR